MGISLRVPAATTIGASCWALTIPGTGRLAGSGSLAWSVMGGFGGMGRRLMPHSLTCMLWILLLHLFRHLLEKTTLLEHLQTKPKHLQRKPRRTRRLQILLWHLQRQPRRLLRLLQNLQTML